MTKVLWLAPNFNHYKARFLNHFAMEDSITLEILSGVGRSGFGDKELTKNWAFNMQQLPVTKMKFGFSKQVRKALKSKFNQYDWIHITAEKKNMPLFLYAIWLRESAKRKGKQVRLFSYNHPVLKSGKGRVTKLDIWLSKFYYKYLDRTIFYTEESCKWAIGKNLIRKENAYWANNTIDTLEINKNYDFSYPPKSPINIVFIGRLIPSKKVDIAIKYFELLQESLTTEHLNLDIIGDGPDANIVKEAAYKNKQIIWHGTLIEESEIAPIMKNCSMVLLPGDSGLSINHAFAYGRPYITLESINHGPEISYISENIDGMILDETNLSTNIKRLEELITNKVQLHEFCKNAKLKGSEITLENWIGKIKFALLDG